MAIQNGAQRACGTGLPRCARNDGYFKVIWFCFLLLYLFSLTLAQANDAELCMRHFAYYEKKYGIPPHLLHSISYVESAKWDPITKKYSPWPWTVNVQGDGKHFKTKQEAIDYVRRAWNKGVRSIDVGCNQINLFFHGHNFRDLEHAFDPQSNINYAANFLKEHYKQTNNWFTSIARYHSAENSRGIPYAKKVLSVWYNKKNVFSQHNLLYDALNPKPITKAFNKQKTTASVKMRSRYKESSIIIMNNSVKSK